MRNWPGQGVRTVIPAVRLKCCFRTRIVGQAGASAIIQRPERCRSTKSRVAFSIFVFQRLDQTTSKTVRICPYVSVFPPEGVVIKAANIFGVLNVICADTVA